MQKHQAARMSRRIAVKQGRLCGCNGGHPGLTVWNLLNYTGIENAHKARKKTFTFHSMAVMYNYCGATEQMRLVW